MKHRSQRFVSVPNVHMRNSSVEVLRIFAVFTLLFTHLLLLDLKQSPDVSMRIVTAFLSQLGGVGDDLFFGISAWFLCVEHAPNLKRNCRRVWILERQLLFYSLLPLILVLSAQFVLHVQVFESSRAVYGAVIHSVFPTISSLWWYPTAYIIFLLIHPMLDRGLRSLGEHGHGMLALVLLAVWGVLPGQSYGMGLSVVLFVFIYVLVSYVRWYRDRWVRSSRIGRNAILTGLLIGGVPMLIAAIANQSFSYLNDPAKLPSLLISFGILSAAARGRETHSRIVNAIASCSLTVYILPGYPQVFGGIWKVIYTVTGEYRSMPWLMLAANIGIIIAVFLGSVAVDLIRQRLFAWTVDRNKGAWFALLWHRAEHWLTTRRTDASTDTSTRL